MSNKDDYSYRSFAPENSASELTAIRAQVIKQEVTRIIRQIERERIAKAMKGQARQQTYRFEIGEQAQRVLWHVFYFFVVAGIVTAVIVLANLLL
jgi:hypothetical protein